jgi:HK97 family phage major capsid protein
MNPLEPDRKIRPDVRAQLAAGLAQYYSELSGMAPKGEPFSLGRLLLGMASGGPIRGREEEVTESAALLLGQHLEPQRRWVPFEAVPVTRAMGTTPGAKGGYLIGVSTLDTADVLRPWSVVASAGATLLTGLADSIVIPRTTTAVTASWIGENAAAPSETPPTLGNVSLVPKTALALVKFSMQLLRQGAAVEAFIRGQLLAAVGELLDTAFFAGTGGTQPLGLLSTTGINTVSGGALAHAGILSMRRKVLDAGGREANLAWVGTPAVQELIGARERAAGGGRFLWDDDGILGKPANATKNAPASALTVGDFGQSTVGIFGPGVRIDVDPSQDFNSGGLVARVLLICDVAFPQPAAFTVASSIT